MPAYDDLKAEAGRRWQELVNGELPWIRIGTVLCGHAVGAYQVIDALKANKDTDETGQVGIRIALAAVAAKEQ